MHIPITGRKSEAGNLPVLDLLCWRDTLQILPLQQI